MSSLNALQTRLLAGEGKVIQVGTDTPVAIRMKYVGTGTVTSVTIVTGTGITMITSDGGTDAYTFAVYTTVGALVDAINKDGIFQCIVLDTLRADATNLQFVNGAITSTTSSEGYAIWDVKVSTSAAFYFAACLTPTNRLFWQTGKGHRVHAMELKYAINMGTAAADSALLYQRDAHGIETVLLSMLSVDTTATTINWASGNAKITAAEGASLIFKVKDAAALADAATNYLQIVGFVE
jgi:hypothetical protein